MRLTVLPNTDTPAYRQIYEQIAGQILSGKLAAGESLPPIRWVAKELGVSVITVRGAWEALEADGLIETRVGSGCFVAALTEAERKERLDRALSPALHELIARAKSLGCSEQELIDRLHTLY